MRATRAFLASLGASLSIVVAGSLALMTVSTVVAFQGWPGISSAQPANQAEVLAAADAGKRASQRSTRPALVVPRRPAVKHVAKARPARKITRLAAPPAVTPQRTVKVQTRPATPAPAAAAATPSVQAKAKAPASRPTPGDDVRKVGTDVGGAVSNAGERLGGVLDKVSPEIGKTVKGVTEIIARVVASTTDMLGKTLDLLTRPPQQP